ncbi:MAG: nodulation protein NfeD [Actinomyces ruminicola]|uniref:NfeD-like C-terminal, partner-binding n=1 Tax=Actinomyces ruminicola TaxID=332524 RepID=A0A1G9Z1R7_9ACTO|nr:nodulation protein NfeD [Actinomyces ruminicola]MBE6481413.1 nodulation protein NfeD [Actinomyces ruminicola]SDN14653.1 NfeD-like C-terminal, partner-binding [Actinomyces ruminicola]
MSLFMWCTVIGCGALLLSLLLDGLFDALDDLLFDGSLPVLACALGVFGAVGMGVQALAGQRLSTAVLVGVPAAFAVAAAAGTRAVWLRLRRSMPRNAVPLTTGELVGSEVRVLWWKDGRGEVMAASRGHQATLPARSDDALRGGTVAWVVDAAADDTLIVCRIDPPETPPRPEDRPAATDA